MVVVLILSAIGLAIITYWFLTKKDGETHDE
jgi:flagellar basal body-associated protein FliL